MPGIFKDKAIPRPFDLSQYSFSPYWLMLAMPWLLLATTLRFLSFYPNPVVGVGATILESFAIFFAFLAAAQRLTEISNGRIKLEDFSLARQFALARDIVLRIYLLVFAVAFVVFIAGARETAPYLLLALDGVAFDQYTKAGMVWSSVLAAIVLMMVVNVRGSNQSTVTNALKGLARHAVWMVPAIVAVAVLQVGLSAFQDLARRGVLAPFMRTSTMPFLNNAAFFLFVLGFAAVRLWASLTILTLALSESYRRRAR